MTRQYWDETFAHLHAFWGAEEARRVLELQHPLFWLYHRDWAFVVRTDRVVAYLVGCKVFEDERPIAYCHLVAVLPDMRGRGCGRALYAHLEAQARRRGCLAIHGMTSPANEPSIAFHRRIGFDATLRTDLWRPGTSRTFFHKQLE